jgi:predicted dehydrogenase
VRIGVIGLGNAARTLHLPALGGLDTDWIGGCDPDAGRRDECAQLFGIDTFRGLAEMIEAGRPDTVLVCTPPETHEAICTEALESGVDVICEKPFANSVEEARRILAVAERTGRRIALNHEFRNVPIYRVLAEAVGGDAGRLVTAQAWQTMYLPPWREAGWRADLLTGTLFEAGIHMLDYLIHLFGERPVAVTAVMSSSGAHAQESDAVAHVTLEFSNGRLAQLTQNRLCPGDLQYFEVRADCEKQSLRASFGGRARVTAGLFRSTRPHFRWEWGASGFAWVERGGTRRRLASNPKDPAMVGTRETLRLTLEAFAGGGEPPVNGEAGLQSLEVLAACYLSAREGRRVALDGEDTAAIESWRLA